MTCYPWGGFHRLQLAVCAALLVYQNEEEARLGGMAGLNQKNDRPRSSSGWKLLSRSFHNHPTSAISYYVLNHANDTYGTVTSLI
ncbi:hypothetical protein PF010_g14445 [Phytophthora fragariae]|uniref:Secreted protein n=1 Tax=Phytophthora fragariae TaxID=53985 RepID=A0A6G0KXJ3_9STRA|nr:hypothetical protein PF010_g14445 [Phytophthora fragariae]